LFLSMGSSTINALIVDLPIDRNKWLCSTSQDEDTDRKFLRKRNLNEIRVLSLVDMLIGIQS